MSYFDGKHIRKELLSTEAQKVAESIVVKDDRERVIDKKSIKSAQLRKFYNEFKGLEKKLNSKVLVQEESDAFLSILPLIKMVKSKVAYASNPSSPKVPQAFADWLKRNVDSINTVDDFRAFLLHFEAVVGFSYGLGLKNN